VLLRRPRRGESARILEARFGFHLLRPRLSGNARRRGTFQCVWGNGRSIRRTRRAPHSANACPSGRCGAPCDPPARSARPPSGSGGSRPGSPAIGQHLSFGVRNTGSDKARAATLSRPRLQNWIAQVGDGVVRLLASYSCRPGVDEGWSLSETTGPVPGAGANSRRRSALDRWDRRQSIPSGCRGRSWARPLRHARARQAWSQR
jgi:hypothetical protein